MLRQLCLVLPLLGPVLLSCRSDPGSDAGLDVQRDTLPNGAVHIRYSKLPKRQTATAFPEKRLGEVDGDPNLVFGDVRGVDADKDGRMFVLDYLASEIRAFDASGAFQHRVAGRGEGPGEIGQANGLILVGDTIIWVQDHSKWMMIGLSPAGEEMARVPMPVLSYGYVWEGTVDNAGRIWKPDHLSDQERTDTRREGLHEVTGRIFLKSLEPSTEVVDSVYLGEFSARWLVTQLGGGWLNSGIPFDPEQLTTVDPDGGFWQVHNATYRIVRFDEVGDTILVLEVGVDAIPVTSSDRAAHIEQSASRDPRFRQVAEEVADLMPETKPQIQKLIVDDEGRLWVERTVREGADPLYDVFNQDGMYQGSVELRFQPHRFLPIRIRHGHIYAVVLDELDVPSIVRAEVPEVLGTWDAGL
jgi:hypothetical protein